MFSTALERTMEEVTKCFRAEFGEDRVLSFGRARKTRSFGELCDGPKQFGIRKRPPGREVFLRGSGAEALLDQREVAQVLFAAEEALHLREAGKGDDGQAFDDLHAIAEPVFEQLDIAADG